MQPTQKEAHPAVRPTEVIQKNKPRASRDEAVVRISGYFYAVSLSLSDRSIHRVGKDRRCTCSLGPDCPAVTAVTVYLRAGGERAPDPPAGYYPVVPPCCPICGGETYFVGGLSSRRRGIGWACRQGSEAHYWLAHLGALREFLTANPWIYPPVYGKDGQVLYPGLRRDDIITESLPWPAGYDPNL